MSIEEEKKSYTYILSPWHEAYATESNSTNLSGKNIFFVEKIENYTFLNEFLEYNENRIEFWVRKKRGLK